MNAFEYHHLQQQQKQDEKLLKDFREYANTHFPYYDNFLKQFYNLPYCRRFILNSLKQK